MTASLSVSAECLQDDGWAVLQSLFPFLLGINPQLKIAVAGPGWAKVCPGVAAGAQLHDCFPELADTDWHTLLDSSGRMAFLHPPEAAGRAFKGQWHALGRHGPVCFLGWPWVASAAELDAWGLGLRDFPPHTPIGDLLLLLQTSQGTLADTRQLAQRLKSRTLALQEANARLDHQATHDSLTGLANRRLLRDRLAHALQRAARNSERVAVLFVDLDRFKDINDTLGHAVGDEVLCEAAQRIQQQLRACDTIGREGGDEFVVILEAAGAAVDVAAIADKLLLALQQPLAQGALERLPEASIGIALYPEHGGDVAELIQHADVAMYEAKRGGRRQYRFYSSAVQTRVQRQFRLESELRGALGRGEMQVHYQPLVRIADGGIAGFEALLRWRHRELGDVSPQEFIDIAEECGLIDELGGWALQTACRFASESAAHGVISVNISPRQFAAGTLPDRVGEVLAETGLPPGRLQLELTENAVMPDPQAAIRQMFTLKAQGVRLALDDFGTGYANLRMLARMPFDVLKIDRGFTAEIPHSDTGVPIAHSILDLAERLRLGVVVEGIEQPAQLAFFQARRCPYAQGYWYARPLPADEAVALLTGGRTLPR